MNPLLLMLGLAHTTAASASLLLNFESVLTAVLAWLVFRENADRRTVLGMLLFVRALRGLGAARTGGYFSIVPFVGAAMAVLVFGEPTGGVFWVAAALMAVGVWLHLTEHHAHPPYGLGTCPSAHTRCAPPACARLCLGRRRAAYPSAPACAATAQPCTLSRHPSPAWALNKFIRKVAVAQVSPTLIAI